MPVISHEIGEDSLGHATNDWLLREVSRAESYLRNVKEALDRDNDDDLSLEPSTSEDEVSQLQSLSHEVYCVSLAKDYLDAVQNGSRVVEGSLSIQGLLQLESRLRIVLQSHNSAIVMAAPSKEFMALYEEIDHRYVAILRHIQASAVLHVRKTLKKLTYPSPSASQFILSALGSSSDADFKTHVQAIQQIDDRILANEFIKPVVQRVKHHFLNSQTIPQDKILKMPHLIIAYLRQLIPCIAPIVCEIECEVYFYQQINSLIQHVLFQRGYFDKISTANPIALTNLVQDVMKYDAFIQDHIREECSQDMASLTEHLICKNAKLFRWWIKQTYTHATHVLDSRKGESNNAITSTTEIFQSLLHSQRAKISLLKQPAYESMFLQKIMIPTCMHYLNLQHERATALRDAMDASTIYNLSSNINQWMMLIEYTAQTAQKLSTLDLPDINSLSESFDKFSDAMVEECTLRYIDLLMERSTLSSFLMTAGHLLSHGSEYAHHNGMEDVYMILNVWNDDDSSTCCTPGRRIIKDKIVNKVCYFLEQQLLEVVLDDLLEMTTNGCRPFTKIVSGMMQAICGKGAEDTNECFGRLKDICRFMLEANKTRAPVYSLLELEDNDKVDYDELELDGTLYQEVESMIRSKGFAFMTVRDAISLINRVS